MTASKTPDSNASEPSAIKPMATPKAKKSKGQTVLRREIQGARRPSNYFWAAATAIGGIGFFLAGISSFLQTNLLPFSDLPAQLVFFPQGLAMSFYGTVALLLCTYLCLVVTWDVGGGFNEFNQNTGEAQIFRSGFPGKNRRIDLRYPLKDILSIRAEIKEGINPKRSLYLKVKGKGVIPTTPVGQPIALSDLENQGAELARFLQVPLEGL